MSQHITMGEIFMILSNAFVNNAFKDDPECAIILLEELVRRNNIMAAILLTELLPYNYPGVRNHYDFITTSVVNMLPQFNRQELETLQRIIPSNQQINRSVTSTLANLESVQGEVESEPFIEP